MSNTNKQTTTGLDALLQASKTIKLATSQRSSNPIHEQAVALMLELGADKEPVTIEKLARTRTLKDAEAVFGSVDKFDNTNEELMEQFYKADAKSSKVLSAIKGNSKGNINNANKVWNVEVIGGAYKLVKVPETTK